MVPLFVPLDTHENLIEKDLVQHVRNLLAAGVHGLLSPSGTGEFFNLTYEVRRRIVDVVVKEVKGEVPVVALASECGTHRTLRHIEAAREMGADGIMLTPPYYTHVNQSALSNHFTVLAEKGGLPLWLYQQPGETKLSIEPDTVLGLSQHPNIVGIKVACGDDLNYYYQILRTLGEERDFCVLMGEDHLCLGALAMGGHGMVSTLSNIIPDAFISLWNAIQENDLVRARQVQHRIRDHHDLLIAVSTGNFQSACKFILEKRGVFSSRRCSLPIHSVSDEELETIATKAKEMGLY